MFQRGISVEQCLSAGKRILEPLPDGGWPARQGKQRARHMVG